MKHFALIGAAGYIAPKHMKAIKDTGNDMVAALDPHDSVGIIDSYFPNAHFFTEPERFDRHLDMLRRSGTPVNYVVVCSPNYLHDAHIRMALRNGADVICEKPLVLNPWNATALQEIERETGHNVSVILQLRLDPAIQELKQRVESEYTDEPFKVEIEYFTPRGKWYDTSWKADENKSGGVATNIGIHLFDMLGMLFGDVERIQIETKTKRTIYGFIYFKKAWVSFILSTDSARQPARKFIVNGQQIPLGSDFKDLHTESYKHILAGDGFTISDALRGIETVYKIRNA